MNSQDRILNAAIVLFGERGYEATALKDIGTQAGHAAGLITHHFKTKAALFLECGRRVLENLEGIMYQGLEVPRNGRETVLLFAQRFLQFSQEQRNAYLVLVQLSPFTPCKAELTSEELSLKVQDLLQRIATALERGQQEGSVRPLLLAGGQPVGATAYALTVFSTILGAARTLSVSPFAGQDQQSAVLAYLDASLSPNGA